MILILENVSGVQSLIERGKMLNLENFIGNMEFLNYPLRLSILLHLQGSKFEV